MSLDCLYKDIEWCSNSFYKSDDCLCDTSIIVPDSMSDIIKIISVKATPLITDTKSTVGRIEITGQVRFNVLYISEDEKSRICTLCSTIPFSHVLTSNSITQDDIPLVNCNSVASSFTLINSRKIKVSALLKFSADTYTINRTKVLSEAPSAETRCETVSVPSYKVICSKNIVVTSNADLPAGKSAIGKILKQSAHIIDSDFKLLNNKVVVKGNIALCLLYDGDGISDATVTVPFTEVCEAEGLSPALDAHVHISIADWDIKPDTDLSGDYKMLDATTVLKVSVLAYTPQSFPVISDIFLPHHSLNTEKSTVKALSRVCVYNEEEFVKDTVTLPSQSPSLIRVIDFDVSLCDTVISDNSLSLTAEVSITYITDDTASPIGTYCAKIPVTHQFASCTPQRVNATAKHTGYAIVSDNSIDVRLGINFELFCSEMVEFTHFTHCEATECENKKRASVLVSFVNSGDSLWDIAKKYNIPLSLLASANALDENAVLTVGEKLIIPR
ncbi:MAG: DUF3794 domain-containing protein [Clostridia bacterium]|nr:DUF3794 domain-containing protein [Clostridia bacterium]